MNTKINLKKIQVDGSYNSFMADEIRGDFKKKEIKGYEEQNKRIRMWNANNIEIRWNINAINKARRKYEKGYLPAGNIYDNAIWFIDSYEYGKSYSKDPELFMAILGMVVPTSYGKEINKTNNQKNGLSYIRSFMNERVMKDPKWRSSGDKYVRHRGQKVNGEYELGRIMTFKELLIPPTKQLYAYAEAQQIDAYSRELFGSKPAQVRAKIENDLDPGLKSQMVKLIEPQRTGKKKGIRLK